ncbi:hypothetical protein RvVAT039_04520 [Agrobacterium vitis]|uniref:Uncharacterized protein n=1 Tax=Agrobacterium vitis TaxID=373 RepID=A0ABD6H846_AGRVI|nr:MULTISPECIES: hypothetical protein [Rhizobium/Agrobacterium group]MUO30023.1 hypothetical protein [Agrobacterium vitis]MUO42387.1 hypothetical protein [Agrobacterium vitis]MUP10699.1 hypothetical protein [Agrobacterium vitis]NSZ53497.1 hypothetical protein [Agrobacterium vitis]NTA32256.1 hypothetical protein [Agrobacterium vitis]
MAKKKKPATITMKLNRDGTMNIRSTGGFDLRKLFPAKSEDNPTDPVEQDTVKKAGA